MVYIPNTPWTWCFLIIAFVESAIILGFEGFVFATFQNNIIYDVDNDDKSSQNQYLNQTQNPSQTRTIPTYLTLFIFAHLFLIVLVYDALRLKNTIQVIGLCIFNGAMLIYAAIQMDQIKEANEFLVAEQLAHRDIWPDIQPFLIAIPCVMGLCTILMSVVAWKLYDEFAWTIYKHISADLRMKRRYLTFQIFVALLKFDFFFFLGFTIQFLVIVLESNDIEFKLTIAVIPLTIIFLVTAAWATRRENLWLMGCVVVVLHGSMAYFLFKLVRMYNDKLRLHLYLPARRSLTSFAVITLLLITVTIANAILCMLNFNKGLKPHITKRKFPTEEEKHDMTEMSPHVAHPVPSRMTID
ncbi:hypothetical protein DFH27DRAFT_29431 [Peziza echinospora]|nr:hypothetical protein DFH27DRAFT_29431 [Peziza echinospora]